MNDIPYERFLAAAERAFEILIDHKYIYKNEIVTKDAIVHVIAGEMHEAQKEENKSITVSLVHKHLPKIFEKMMEEVSPSKK